MAQLAIKGHATRGREVIQLLEMLGGKSNSNMNGYNDDLYYFIAKDGLIYGSDIEYEELNCKYTIFTLEEFLEKFPYKVGDKVNSPCKGCIKTITSMWWDTYLNTITYKLDHRIYTNIDQLKVVNDLQPYKEEGVNLQELERKLDEALEKETTESLNKWLDEENMNTNNLCTRCVYAVDNHCGLRGFTNDFNRFYCSAQNADKLPNGFELQPDGYFSWVDSKPQYPKDYEESCKVLGISRHDVEIDLPHPYQQKMFNLFKLHICRNAYWKIAGKQLGLDKQWEPEWTNTNSNKYCIYYVGDEIKKQPMLEVHHFLAFPTAEMRDAFFENFKDLIEQCKEML